MRRNTISVFLLAAARRMTSPPPVHRHALEMALVAPGRAEPLARRGNDLGGR